MSTNQPTTEKLGGDLLFNGATYEMFEVHLKSGNVKTFYQGSGYDIEVKTFDDMIRVWENWANGSVVTHDFPIEAIDYYTRRA